MSYPYKDIDINEACEILSPPKHTLILLHANPDGDAVGSAFALKILIENLGGTALCVCCDEAPGRLNFLYSSQNQCEVTEDTDTDALLASAQRIVAVDVASPSQLGKLREIFEGKIDLAIDHHMTGEAIGSRFIDSSAAASGELVFDISEIFVSQNRVTKLKESGFYERVYAAVSSDTGCFKYSNVTPETHKRAAQILEYGTDAADINIRLFDSRTKDEMRGLVMTYENIRFHCDGKLSSLLITRELLEKYELCDREIGNIVDNVRAIEGVMIGITVKQTKDDLTKFRVSSRANSEIDVASVCARFDGGGHIRAAGCSLTADTPEEAYEIIINAFSEKIMEISDEHENE